MKNLMALCGALCALSLSLQGAQAPLVISEIMAENDSGLVDENGNRVDWIEIQNVSSDSVDLENFALSDDRANPTQWSFPEQSLAPGAFLIVFASGKDRAADQDCVSAAQGPEGEAGPEARSPERAGGAAQGTGSPWRACPCGWRAAAGARWRYVRPRSC